MNGPGDSETALEANEKVAKVPTCGELLDSSTDAATDESKLTNMPVEEIAVTTEEEEEEEEDTRYLVRAKLFQFDVTAMAYKERGVGPLKLVVPKTGESGARLVMRAGYVHRVVLNAALFRGMAVFAGPDPKFVRLTSLEDGKPVSYAIRLYNSRHAEELFQAIQEYIPTDEKGYTAAAAATTPAVEA